jgi:hypothetical protein
MQIDIDKLSEAELVALNRRVVERLRFLQQAREHVSMLRFAIGDRACFEREDGTTVRGTIIRYNKRTVSLIATDGLQWKVSPGLLRADVIEGEVGVQQGLARPVSE